ncbi:hypothetical protein HZA73_06700, partial [candidate division TA06 bacterium]|nr:hypothetical protein [candidate division TA06 bacterium]
EVSLRLYENDPFWEESHNDKISLPRLVYQGVLLIEGGVCYQIVHTDYLNSPRVMTDASGAVVWRQDYLAFGADYGTAATGNTHKFTGHIKDDATGQYYAKARYFTTGLGRWSQPEPLLQGVPDDAFLNKPQLLNPYIYCENNPLKYIDRNGKWSDPANADQFIEAARNFLDVPYGHGQFPDKVDCTGLVFGALTTLDDNGISTELIDNWNTIGNSPRDQSMAKGIYDEAKSGKSNLSFINNISDAKPGDLLVQDKPKGSGHVEIITGIKDNKITSISASSNKNTMKVVERKPFNPWDPKGWWKKEHGGTPKIVRINEK